jgi:hypothetical protein
MFCGESSWPSSPISGWAIDANARNEQRAKLEMPADGIGRGLKQQDFGTSRWQLTG